MNIKEINIELIDYQTLGETLLGDKVLNELQKFYEEGVRINVRYENNIIKTFHKDD